jgi:excisionase family DNA binding protein
MRFPGKSSAAVLKVSEVSEYLRIHPTTLYRLLRKHEIPAFKIGNDWRISAEAMNRWLEEIETRGAETETGSAETVADAKPSDRRALEDISAPKFHWPKARN